MGREGSTKMGAGTRKVMQKLRKTNPQPRKVLRADKKNYQKKKRAGWF